LICPVRAIVRLVDTVEPGTATRRPAVRALSRDELVWWAEAGGTRGCVNVETLATAWMA